VPVPLSTKDLDNDITKFAIKNQSPCIPLHGIVELFAVVMNRDESEIGNLMVFSVLRIRIRDPGSGTFLPPGSGIRDPGSGKNHYF
jgi:hypothetical protein